MENFEKFYENPSVEEMKILLKEGKIKQSNLYDFLVGYKEYLVRQVKMDSF